MHFMNNFRKIIINRDFRPVSGSDHFFQCYLPMIGSIILLSILCFAGMMSIAIFIDTLDYVKSLEDDPFASAISIDDPYRTRAEFLNLKKNLYFNKVTKRFLGEKQSNCINVIEDVIPYKRFQIFLMPKDSIKLPNNFSIALQIPYDISNSNNNKSSKVHKWINENLIFDHNNYFKSGNRFSGIILSHGCYSQLCYKSLPDTIRIVSAMDTVPFMNSNVPTINNYLKHTYEIPVINVGKNLPGNDALVVEPFYDYVIKQKQLKSSRKVNAVTFLYDEKNKNSIYTRIVPELKHAFRISESKMIPQSVGCRIKFHDNKRPTIYKLHKELWKLKNKYPKLDLKYNLSLNQSDYQEKPSRINGAFVFVNKDTDLLEHIDQLVRILKYKEEIIVDSHQVMTLKRYRKDLDKLTLFTLSFLCFILIIMFLYIFITFCMLLQSKMHEIGMIMAMGASQYSIRKIYSVEAYILIIIPIIISFILMMITNYYMNIVSLTTFFFLYLTVFSFTCIVFAYWGSRFAIKKVVSRSPSKLISYRS